MSIVTLVVFVLGYACGRVTGFRDGAIDVIKGLQNDLEPYPRVDEAI